MPSIIETPAKSQSLVLLPDGRRITQAEADRMFEEQQARWRARPNSPQSDPALKSQLCLNDTVSDTPPPPAELPQITTHSIPLFPDTSNKQNQPVMETSVPPCTTSLLRFTGKRGGGFVSAAAVLNRMGSALLGGGETVCAPREPGAGGGGSHSIAPAGEVESRESPVPAVTGAASPGISGQGVLELGQCIPDYTCEVTNSGVPSATPVQRPPWPTQRGYPKGPGTVLHDAWGGQGLSRGARELMALLVRVSGGKESCNPSRKYIADKLKTSAHSVVRWMRELVQADLVWIKRRWRAASMYFLRAVNKAVQKPVENKEIQPSESSKVERPLAPVSLLGLSNLKPSVDATLQIPVENQSQPQRKPPRRELQFPVEDWEEEIVVRHLGAFQKWIDKPLNQDRSVVRLTIEAGLQFGANCRQIGSELGRILLKISDQPRLKPKHWGFFPPAVAHHFRREMAS